MDYDFNSSPTYTDLSSKFQQPNSSEQFTSVMQNYHQLPYQTMQRANQQTSSATFRTQNSLQQYSPMCKLNCNCCTALVVSGKVCSCNVYKITVSTQTDNVQLNFEKEEYFKPKTSAYKLLQSEISRVTEQRKFHSALDDGFEVAVSSVISFIGDLQDTPSTREKVRQRMKKRIYNQQNYEKTKSLAVENGVSVKKCQSAAVKRSLQFQHVVPEKQPRLTPEINPLPSMSSTLTDQPDPETTDNSSCSTESQDNMTDGGVKVQVNNTVCIARSKTSCDYAKVTSIWKTKVDISYFKKTTKGLIPWMLPGNKPYTDSVHINSIFYSLGNQLELSETDLHAIKNKLKDIFS